MGTMPRRTKKPASKATDKEVVVLQILETEPEQLTKIAALVWGMTGAAIGGFLLLMSIMGLVLSLLPGMPKYPVSGSMRLIFFSLIITFVLTIFYGMMGGLMGALMSNAINWVLHKMGGIKFKVRLLV